MSSVKKDDWRIRKSNLQDRVLVEHSFTPILPAYDHEHCDFCWEEFGAQKDDLHSGFSTLDNAYWVCPTCYKDFHKYFNLVLLSDISESCQNKTFREIALENSSFQAERWPAKSLLAICENLAGIEFKCKPMLLKPFFLNESVIGHKSPFSVSESNAQTYILTVTSIINSFLEDDEIVKKEEAYLKKNHLEGKASSITLLCVDLSDEK